MFDSILFYFITYKNQNLILRIQYPSFTKLWAHIAFLFSYLLGTCFSSPRTSAFFHHYHRLRLTFPLKCLITLSTMSVTCCSDHFHRLQFKPKPSYFHHFAGNRVAAVHEEASLTPRRQLRRCWWTPKQQWRGRRRNHCGAVETNAGESDGDNCYMEPFHNTTIRYVVSAMV